MPRFYSQNPAGSDSPVMAITRKSSSVETEPSGASMTTASQGEVPSSSCTSVGDMTPPGREVTSPDLSLCREIPAKSTFVHFDAESSPMMGLASSAPAALEQELSAPALPQLSRTAEADGADSGDTPWCESLASLGSSASSSSAGSPCSATASPTASDILLWPGDGLDRTLAAVGDAAAQGVVRLSAILACKRAGLVSLGAQAHRVGRCVPCLMQVRWAERKYGEPCRFGFLCNRCHEPHDMEALERAQAQMRKHRRRSARRSGEA